MGKITFIQIFKRVWAASLSLILCFVVIQCVTDDRTHPFDKNNPDSYVGDSIFDMVAKYAPDCSPTTASCDSLAKIEQEKEFTDLKIWITGKNDDTTVLVVGSQTFLLTGTIRNSGELIKVEISTDNEITWKEADLAGDAWSQILQLAKGENYIVIKASQILNVDGEDQLENVEKSFTIAYDDKAQDNEKPVLLNVNLKRFNPGLPGGGLDTTNENPYRITGSYSDASGADIFIDNVPAHNQVNENWDYTKTLVEGLNFIEVRAVDRSPQSNTKKVPYGIFYHPLSVEIISPAATSPDSNPVIHFMTSISVEAKTDGYKDANQVTINGVIAVKNDTSWSAPVTLNINGTTQIIVSATNTDNETALDTINVDQSMGDQQKPIVSLLSHSPGDTITLDGVLLKVSVTDDISGIESVFITYNNANLPMDLESGNTYSRHISNFTPGSSIDFKITATDNSPNKNAKEAHFSLFYNTDEISPSISLISHEDSQAVNSNQVLLQFDVSDASELKSVTVNGSPASYNDSLKKFEYNISLSASGAHTLITVIATDAFNNQTTKNFWLIYDVLPPTVDIGGLPTTVYADSLLVKVTAGDASGIKSVVIQNVAAEFEGGVYQANISLENGNNQIIAVATDSVGNTSEDTVNIVLVDNTPPEISLVGQTEGDSIYMVSMIKVKVTDESGIKWVKIQNQNATKTDNDVYELEITLEEGENQIIVTSHDAIETSNLAADTFNLIGIDTAGPVISYLSPLDGDTLLDDTLVQGLADIKINVSDVSDIEYVKIANRSITLSLDPVGGFYHAKVALQSGLNQLTIEAKDGSLNSNITNQSLNLFRHVPIKSVDVQDINVTAGAQAAPHITYTPPNASIKSYKLSKLTVTSYFNLILDYTRVQGITAHPLDGDTRDGEQVLIIFDDPAYMDTTFINVKVTN